MALDMFPTRASMVAMKSTGLLLGAGSGSARSLRADDGKCIVMPRGSEHSLTAPWNVATQPRTVYWPAPEYTWDVFGEVDQLLV